MLLLHEIHTVAGRNGVAASTRSRAAGGRRTPLRAAGREAPPPAETPPPEPAPPPNRVLVVLGDHQPHGYVSGPHPGHDVPISVIAQDKSVVQRIAGWNWQPGLRPRPDAPVWRMDTFRNRFLEAFSR